MSILVDYRGRDIRLTDERKEHIFQHREMAGMEHALEQTLRDPERVIQSKSDEIARLYYRIRQQHSLEINGYAWSSNMMTTHLW